MLARIEVATRPEFADPAALGVLRRIEVARPEFRRKVRWARALDVYWMDLPVAREELIPAISEVFLDRVLQWLFTGNLLPSAAGKNGGLLDLMEAAPQRPGKFWAVERRFRPGVTDNVARTTLEALEIVLGRKFPDGRAASGSLFLFEGTEIGEDELAQVARDVLCNELIETWTIIGEAECRKNDRFHQERIKRDLPKVIMRGSEKVEDVPLASLSDSELKALSEARLWALSLPEMQAARDYFSRAGVLERRAGLGLGLGIATDVEMEVIAQTWSEHCKHKIFNARIDYQETVSSGAKIPAKIDSLFKATIAGTTAELTKPWLLSVFEDNAGIVAFDEQDAFCIKVETHNSPSALDPYGGALTGIVGVNRDILGCGLGAKPIFNTDVFCVAPLDYSEELPERLLHPRRILDGVRRGVEHGGNKSGIPTVNGALVFDRRYLGKPLVYCGTGGFMPRKIAGRNCELKEIHAGDRICMVGGRIGKDGIHGATFSSLAMDERSPVTAVQLGDPITQKRAADFLLEARDMGLYRAITDNGAGGLSSSVGELARLSNGARMDVSQAKTKYPGLRPYELVVSESQERMTLAVPPDRMSLFLALAERRGVEVSDLGEFTASGRFDIFYGEKPIASLDSDFLHGGTPKLELTARWNGLGPMGTLAGAGSAGVLPARDAGALHAAFEAEGGRVLLGLLGRPNIASKEWLIRQYDHEVQGTSVVKPLHTAAPGAENCFSGPNDGGVLKPKPSTEAGIAVACGINPKLSDVDPYLMAQAAVDEAVRNVLCVGADFGKEDSVLALVDNFCWPDPVTDEGKAAALVRACYGMRDAALALGAPLVSGKDSMKNDFRGKLGGKPVVISVVPTLLMTAVAKVSDTRHARTADFKSVGDVVYRLSTAPHANAGMGLLGSELHSWREEGSAGQARGAALPPEQGFHAEARVGRPDWVGARALYGWIGGASGKLQPKLRSLHDISDGGLLCALAESSLARAYGVSVRLEQPVNDPWETFFGEGFHAFVASASEADSAALEKEWGDLGVGFERIGVIDGRDRLDIQWNPTDGGSSRRFSLGIRELRQAWQKEGYWE